MSEVKRSAEANYQGTLTIPELCKLDIDSIADPAGCVLCLWVVNSQLQEGLDVMKAWGFKQKQIFTWIKTTSPTNETLAFGMGRMFRASTEMCLIGIKGKNVYKNLMNKSQRNVSLDQNLKHSQKPETLQERLELMWPAAAKLELFARRKRSGWACAGNELQIGEDISTSLDNLANDRFLWKYDDNYLRVISEDSNEDQIERPKETGT